MEELMSAYEVAEKLGISHMTVYNWQKKGLPYKEVRRGIKIFKLYELEAVKKWIEENTQR